MRGVILIVLAMACGHDAPLDSRPPAASKGPTACARAADNLVKTMLDRLTHQDAPPTEQADALRNLIRERCERDAWSPDATQCLIAMQTQADAGPCAQRMTDDQQAALVRDEQAEFAAKPANPAPRPAPNPAPNPAP